MTVPAAGNVPSKENPRQETNRPEPEWRLLTLQESRFDLEVPRSRGKIPPGRKTLTAGLQEPFPFLSS